MTKFSDWEVVEPLGSGGQSEVYKVRTPARSMEREKCLKKIRTALDGDDRRSLAEAIWTYARPDAVEELGALKHFKIPAEGSSFPPPPDHEQHEAIERLKNESTALRRGRPGLPRLLDFNEDQRWIVTELFSEGTLEDHIQKYRGNVAAGLRAFRFLVATTASLHSEGYVHRDIKPANVFVRNNGELILGDFGLIYVPSAEPRLTTSTERVGPRDFIPLWGDFGQRLAKVQPNFDVYMLGKLLWCMIAGRLKLPRECYRRPEFDLSIIFPDDRRMQLINSILDKCVVEQPDECLPSARELLRIVDQNLMMLDHGVPVLDGSGKLTLPCRICGRGYYQDEGAQIRPHTYNAAKNEGQNPIYLRVFVCNVCTHREFFAPNYPEEAASRNWKLWRT